MSDEQEAKHHLKEFHIKIDRTDYVVNEDELTGAQLRAIPSLPIGPERDLWEVIPGKDDRKLADTDVVEMSNGKRFFTTPAHINPGGRQGRK